MLFPSLKTLHDHDKWLPKALGTSHFHPRILFIHHPIIIISHFFGPESFMNLQQQPIFALRTRVFAGHLAFAWYELSRRDFWITHRLMSDGLAEKLWEKSREEEARLSSRLESAIEPTSFHIVLEVLGTFFSDMFMEVGIFRGQFVFDNGHVDWFIRRGMKKRNL